jgi:predicted Zn-dependent protease
MTADAEQLQQLADRVVELVTERAAASAPDAEVEANVLVTRTRHGLTRFANSFVHQHVGEDTRSVRLELAVDGRTSVASSTALDDARDRAGRRDHRRGAAAAGRPALARRHPAAAGDGDEHVDAATVDPEPDERARHVRNFVDAGEQLSAAGYVDTETQDVAFASTAGQRAAATSTRATVDGIHQTSTSAGSAHQTSLALATSTARPRALAADRARRSAQFVDVDPATSRWCSAPRPSRPS